MKTFNKYLLKSNKKLLKFNFEKFEIKFLDKFLSASSLTSMANKIIDIRTDAFKLQSFGRVLRRCGDDRYIDIGNSIRDDAKFCEDAMGRFLYSYEMFCMVKKGSSLYDQSASDLLVAYFDFIEIIPEILSKQKNIKLMIEELPSDHLELKKLYLKGLRKELKKIKNKISEIDSLKLEDGTHKLRRLLRWVIMHIIYPQGLFGFKDIPKDGPSQFLVLKPSAVNEPVSLSYALFSELSSYVGTLGSCKDKLLYHHYEVGLNNELVDINKSNQATINLTRNIIDGINGQKLIKKIRKEISEEGQSI